MAQNYTRQSTLSDGDTITASLFNDEYNQLVNAFTYSSSSASSTGHRHDGSAGQGGNIFKIGDLDFLNKIEVDSTNNRLGFYVEVSSAAVEQVRIQDGAVVPVTSNDIDLGTSSLQFKDLHIDGTANIDSLTLASGATVTAVLDEDNMSSDSATALVTQQSIKAYVDSQVTAQDLDFQADSGGALSIDLDSETMTFTGGTGIDTSGSGNAVTFAIDSTVATLAGTQTLTNKTLTSPDVNTPDIDGGTIDNTVIGGSTAAAGSFTTVSATGNITVGGTVDGRDVATDGSKLDGIEASADVTDATNVTAAGALMDSELTSIASVKALNQGVATSDSPTFAGITTSADINLGDNVSIRFGDVTNGDLVIKHDGTDSKIADRGTGDLIIQGSTNIKLQNFGGTKDYFTGSNNGASTIFHDGSAKLATTSTGIDVTGTAVTDGLTVDGTASISSSSASDVQLTLTNTDAGSSHAPSLDMRRNSASPADDDQLGRIRFRGENDAGENVTYASISVLSADVTDGSEDGTFRITTKQNGADKQRVSILSAETVLNEQTGDIDFRVESDGNTHALFVDAGNDRVGIFNSSPSTALDVTGAITTDGLTTSEDLIILHSTTDHLQSILGTDGGGFAIEDNNYFAIWHQDIANVGTDTGITERFRVDSSGNFLLNGTNATGKLVVDGDANAYTARFNSNTTTGQAFGARVRAGTNSSDFAVLVENTSATTMFAVRGDGNCGVGTSSPAYNLVVSNAGASGIEFGPAYSGTANLVQHYNRSGSAYVDAVNDAAQHRFNIGGSEKMRLDSSGNVGIGGISSPDNLLHVYKGASGHSWSFDGGDAFIVESNDSVSLNIATPASNSANILFSDANARGQGRIIYDHGSDYMGFHTGGISSERMRIDSSGNLMVGTTNTTPGAGNTTAGISLFNDGRIFASKSANTTMSLNRNTSDGNIVELRKDGTSVGSIGIANGDLNIDGDTGIRFQADSLMPRSSGSDADATVDLGLSTHRFKDLHLSGTANAGGLDVSGAATITTANNSAQLTLKSTDTDSAVGPRMDLIRDSASPADGDLAGQIRFLGDNDAGEQVSYGFIRAKLLDVSDGSEDGQFDITLKKDGTDRSRIRIQDTELVINEDSIDMDFRVESDGASHMLYVDAGNDAVGIGTSTPTVNLEVSSGTIHNQLRVHRDINGDNTTMGAIALSGDDSGGNVTDYARIKGLSESDNAGSEDGGIIFETMKNATISEVARLDSDGNLLVGKSSSDIGATAGLEWYDAADVLTLTRSGGHAIAINRLSSNGEACRIRKDGTTVGSIGIRSGTNLYVAFRTESAGDGCGLTGSSASDGAIIPSDGDGDAVDDHIDLGASSTRFDDIHATNGTIQTSDRNEKQDIEELSDAEQRVAVACKGLLRKFRWKSAVADKGDDARIHFGIIAQDLQAAFEAESLDAGRYGMFISTTWTDEETGQERTRMGVRYSELLAFIIAAI